ncbi:hypothetical protein DASC09_053870 [Saccharomycopsis crataegensis]|uniref:J domain-containing protein n=1 Tax=Saccharomycopsis crataegensis TaxID=43959 RepID=A0AAV5QUH9_9ASCO|nr:hypothetical protein DASC09_053870 [Saccharomycopsis crataegensis]
MVEYTFEDLKKQNIDIYAAIGTNNLASDAQIRKCYRLQALKYHPDKNPSASALQNFHRITDYYKFLTNNKEQRAKYDEWLAHKDKVRSTDYEDQKRRELELLEKRWMEEERHEKQNKQLIERLRDEGMRQRLIMEEERFYKSHHASEIQDVLITDDLRTVEVKWKLKESIKDMFNEAVLTHLMEVFGPVKSCQIIKGDEKYGYGSVIFDSVISVMKISELGDLEKRGLRVWENSGYRTLGKLIKSVRWKYQDGNNSDLRPSDAILKKIMEKRRIDYQDTTAIRGLEFGDYKEITLMRLSNVL